MVTTDGDTSGDGGLDPELVAMVEEVARGRSVAEIAAQQRLSPRTVRRRLAHLRDAWGCRNNIVLAVEAVRRHII
ncbi:helix-turn-helix domain-containing protein [Nocardioides sp. TF02-7]|uniref:helix-turn-helix domain-containing protein n=1 Tax=Nocardioides sp. TF02-7 TaxID=2917724 RepID=UPI001F051210|nr:helix-turn-helix domain-containing protein [Nocardioides sp. TF02-7]UMG93987.1 helix-turn-helix domain-containing protein [Nocardioides sp. TF02-7]